MHRVKVRLKINTTRYLGTIEYPSHYFRFSDFLDGDQEFIKILQPESADLISTESILLVNKKNILYIHSIEEEYRKYSFSPNGEFFQATIWLKDGERIKGLIFCSYEESNYPMEGILRQTGCFLKVRTPVIVGTSEKYNFLALGKSEILTVEVDPAPYVLDASPEEVKTRVSGSDLRR
jgi:hypothetical protein